MAGCSTQNSVSAKQSASSLWANDGVTSGQVQKSATTNSAANLNRGTERLQDGIITTAEGDIRGGDAELT